MRVKIKNAYKKHLRGKNHFFAYLHSVLLLGCVFYAFCACKIFSQKKTLNSPKKLVFVRIYKSTFIGVVEPPYPYYSLVAFYAFAWLRLCAFCVFWCFWCK